MTPLTSYTISIGNSNLIIDKIKESNPFSILKVKLGVSEEEDKYNNAKVSLPREIEDFKNQIQWAIDDLKKFPNSSRLKKFPKLLLVSITKPSSPPYSSILTMPKKAICVNAMVIMIK